MQSIPFIRSRMAVREMVSFDFISIINGLTIAPYDAALWTVLQLIIFVMWAPVFYVVLKNKYVGIVALIITFIIVRNLPNIPLLIHGNIYLLTYLFGAYIGLHIFDRIKNLDYSVWHYVLAFGGVIIFCILFELGRFNISNVIYQSMGILGLYVVCYFVSGYTEKSAEICYGLSFWIYAMHNWLQPCIMKLWLMTGIKGNTGALISTFGMAAITVIICIITAKLCKKRLPRMYSILSGGR